jgi:hypothetical protein
MVIDARVARRAGQEAGPYKYYLTVRLLPLYTVRERS